MINMNNLVQRMNDKNTLEHAMMLAILKMKFQKYDSVMIKQYTTDSKKITTRYAAIAIISLLAICFGLFYTTNPMISSNEQILYVGFVVIGTVSLIYAIKEGISFLNECNTFKSVYTLLSKMSKKDLEMLSRLI